MKLGLVQTKHNRMYDFLGAPFTAAPAARTALQQEQLARNFALLDSAAGGGFDLLVTTECINFLRPVNGDYAACAAGYPPLDSAPVRRLSAAAKAAGSWLVAGLGCQIEGKAANAALVFDRSGTLRQVYRKLHLAGDEGCTFTPGDAFGVQKTEFGTLGVCICWDMQFPETARILAGRGADLIVVPTWGWEGDMYGRARAYENGVYVAAAMAVPGWGDITPPRTPSSVVTPQGDYLAMADAAAPGLLTCTLDPADCAAARAMRLGGRRPALYGELSV